MDLMSGWKRTDYCGCLRAADIGREVTVAGWVQRQRDLGSLIFVDLRDREGIIQLAFGETSPRQAFEKAAGVKSEYVLMARGTVRERSSKNAALPTGDIEIDVSELKVLAESETPPFDILADSKTAELTRLQYRYLDLRRPDLQKNILLRHKISKITRDYFDENGFVEIETPILIRSTPEGARDYLVPSRLHKGSFYALPQSPQLYKQLSMVAGFDRYMQIARCFRDEDLRADRQPEFTQIDLEMSFVDMEDIFAMIEGYIKRVFSEVIGVEVATPIRRLTYGEAMELYGCDKPDTRYGMEIFDIGDIAAGSAFTVFSGAAAVKGITAKNAFGSLTRKEIDKLTEYVRGVGAKGLAFIRIAEDGAVSSSFGKFSGEQEVARIIERAGAGPGDVVLLIADAKKSLALSATGALRIETAKKLGIIPKERFDFLWITDFPFFDYDEELGEYVAMHHPFTSPSDDSLAFLETDKAAVKAKAYDLVLNGIELSSGSIRITNPELQQRIFSLLGLTEEKATAKFGYLLEAFKYGPPPHGGMALGLDRLVMQMLGCESLRDVVAFPKVQNASEPMTKCPARVDGKQLEELGLALLPAAQEEEPQ